MNCPHLNVREINLAIGKITGGGVARICVACGQQIGPTSRGRWLSQTEIAAFVRLMGPLSRSQKK